MTLSQRTWQHADGDDGDDPLTNLIYSGPNRSIRPPLPWFSTRVMWRVFAGEAILTALALVVWLIWR